MSPTYAQWVKRLLVGILEQEERTGKDHADLAVVCDQLNIDFNEDWLCRFLNENQPHFGSGAGIVGIYTFALNAPGREKAEGLRRSTAPRTFGDRIREVPRSDWIAFGALLVSLIALFE